MDGFGAVAAEQREMMHFPRRAGLDHQAGAGAQTFLDEMLVDGGGGEQGRNGHVVGVD